MQRLSTWSKILREEKINLFNYRKDIETKCCLKDIKQKKSLSKCINLILFYIFGKQAVFTTMQLLFLKTPVVFD